MKNVTYDYSMKNKIVFALFGDGKFISWTYGMFTQLVDYPKVYTESNRQIEVVQKNFYSKIKRINKESEFHKNPGLEEMIIVDQSQNKESKILSGYSNFELRMYYLPESENVLEIDLDIPVIRIPYVDESSPVIDEPNPNDDTTKS